METSVLRCNRRSRRGAATGRESKGGSRGVWETCKQSRSGVNRWRQIPLPTIIEYDMMPEDHLEIPSPGIARYYPHQNPTYRSRNSYSPSPETYYVYIKGVNTTTDSIIHPMLNNSTLAGILLEMFVWEEPTSQAPSMFTGPTFYQMD